MMALLDGEPSGKAGSRCKPCLRVFIWLFTSVYKMWVRIRAQAAGVLTFLPRFQSSSSEEESWLWCWFALTFGPTRSGTGMTHASGQALPLIRTLLDTLVCEPQARLRTFPGNNILGTRGDGVCWIKVGGQKR